MSFDEKNVKVKKIIVEIFGSSEIKQYLCIVNQKISVLWQKDIDVIQLVEFCIWDAVVAGSSPVIYTKFK